MTEPAKVRVHPIAHDIPLPGHYPCLTLQVNVTRYHGAQTLRWIVSAREPNENLEVYRSSLDTTPWTADSIDGLCFELRQALRAVEWLQEGKNE